MLARKHVTFPFIRLHEAVSFQSQFYKNDILGETPIFGDEKRRAALGKRYK